MPELPEVEWNRRWIARHACGAEVEAVALLDPAVVRRGLSTLPSDADPDGSRRLDALIGQRSLAVERHGKRLRWSFERDGALVHLGMTGVWSAGAQPRFARLGLRCGGTWLWFSDSRRFGAWSFGGDPAGLRAGHGPDALLEPLDGGALRARLRGRRPVKVALMDPSVIAGLGNIHAVEILWDVGVHPERRCDALTDAELDRLAAHIPVWLARQVEELCAADTLRYLSAGAENPFRVYGRVGAPCPRCGAAILGGRHSGRSTAWCPTCQP